MFTLTHMKHGFEMTQQELPTPAEMDMKVATETSYTPKKLQNLEKLWADGLVTETEFLGLKAGFLERLGLVKIQALVRRFLERRSMYMLESHSLKGALKGRHRLLVLHLTGYKGPHDWLAPYPEAHDSRLNADALQVEFYKFFDEIDPGMRGCFGGPGDYWYDIEVSRMHDAEKRQGELDAVIRANPGAPTKYLAATLAKHGWNLDVPKFEAWNEKVLFMPPLSTPVCIVCLFDPKGEKWGEEGGEFECGACRGEPCFQWNATSNEDEGGSFPVKGTHCTCKKFIKESTDSLIRCFEEHELISKSRKRRLASSEEPPRSPRKRRAADPGRAAFTASVAANTATNAATHSAWSAAAAIDFAKWAVDHPPFDVSNEANAKDAEIFAEYTVKE